MSKFIYFFLVLGLLGMSGYSQTGYSISGLINEDSGAGAAFANVLVLAAVDSTLVKGSLTKDDGTYELNQVSPGEYIVMSSLVGYQSAYSKRFVLNGDYEVETLVISEGEALSEVLVQYTKPLYEQKVDRMVINVENSIVSAGSSALEVLERSPGVSVNRQSNTLSLVGKSGVVIMINGKQSYMPQSSLVQLLEGMSADNIESIELITTPPANFDAEGNAGFINIVLKKETNRGLNGAYSISGGFGNGTTTSDNLSFNYRKNGINLYGNYSFLRREQGQTFNFDQQFLNEDDVLKQITTESDRDPTQRNHNIRMGMDYQMSENTVLGTLLSAYDNKWTMEALNLSEEFEDNIPSAFVELYNTERNQWKHFGANLNLKHNFNPDEYISFDIDYLHYRDENPTDYTNSFFDFNNELLREELTLSDKTTPINIIVGKLDYSKKIGDDLEIQSGVKGAFSNFENDVSVENFDGQDFIEDPSLTNFSNLDERILAAYTSLNYNLSEKTVLILGLRYEHTDSELDTDREGRVVDRSNGTFFPSAYISHKINDTLGFNLSYSKRITRPTFNDMAPFVIFFDPTTFFAGNPAIKPAISNGVKFDITYKSMILSAQYSIEDERIQRFIPENDQENGRLLYKAANIDQTKIFSITLALPLTLTHWWKAQNNFIYLNTKVEDIVDDLPLESEQNTFNINTSHLFTLTKNLSSEIVLNYFGPRIAGVSETKSIFGMNVGIQKKISDKWGTVRLSVNDIWDSLKFERNTLIPEQNLNATFGADFSNRTISLTYSRTFGNRDLRGARNRETGSEEERRRVN